MSEWIAPAGIPRPSFGLDEVAPAPTLVIQPGQLIPSQLPAGTVLSVTGTHMLNTQANGTKDKPVWIIGGTYMGENNLTGSYVILQNIVSRSGLYVNGSYVAIRDSEFSGGGIAIVQWLDPSRSPSNIVVLRGNFHDVGSAPSTWPTGGDADSHGVGVGHHSSYVWILDSTFSRISGDSVQVNGEQFGSLTHHIYVGRNQSTQNRQSGGWAKQSQDVVFSENTATNMRGDSIGNPGLGFGGQYEATRLVLINNQVSDSNYGIKIGGDSNSPFRVLAAGNRISNIHNPENSASNPQSPGAALCFTNNGDKIIVKNTVDDVDTGLGVSPSGGALVVMNNPITRAKRESVYEGVSPVTGADFTKILAEYQSIHGVPLGVDLGGSPVITPVPTPTPTPTPVPPSPIKPVCPHTFVGLIGYLSGRCTW